MENMHTHSALTLQAAHDLWEFHNLHHDVSSVVFQPDMIFIMGSHDTRVAERGAEMYHLYAHRKNTPIVVCSGGLGRLTDGTWHEPEAVVFARVAEQHGVPATMILQEAHSTNTAENVRFTADLLREQSLAPPQTILLIHKPYMERRAWSTFMAQWALPTHDVRVTSPQCTMEQYITEDISFDDLVHLMVGDLQRLRIYGEKGWNTPQAIPHTVWAQMEWLIAQGYDRHVVR
jgi:hypothetical protein